MITPSGYDAAPAELVRFLNFVTSRHRDSEWVACGRTWQRQPDGRWLARQSESIEHDMAAVDRAATYGALEMRSRDQLPGWDDLRKEFGPKLEVVDNADGTRDGTIRNMTAEDRKRLIEMESGHIAVQTEISERRGAESSFVEMVDTEGRKRHVAAEHEDRAGKKSGMRRPLRVKARKAS